MKIKKLTEQIIREAEENTDGIVVIDADDSTKEVEKKLDAVASTPAQEKAVEEIPDEEWKPIGDRNFRAGRTAVYSERGLGVDNTITRLCESCLRAAIAARDQNKTNTRANLRLVGLPGSGKTASVYDWAYNARGSEFDYHRINGKNVAGKITNPKYQRINLVYMNMKNNDLDAFINGYPVHRNDEGAIEVDKDADGKPFKGSKYGTVGQAYSSNLDILNIPNSVLLLDEYNRQKDDQIRAGVLTLINEHFVAGEENGRKYFPNFLFTIAIENPSGQYDTGAAKENDAEKSRFFKTREHMDSSKEDCAKYLKAEWLKKVKEELAYEDANYNYIENWLRILDMGLWIVEENATVFKFDGEGESDENTRAILGDLDITGKTMLNQRSLCTGLEMSNGNKDEMIDWVKYDSNFLSKAESAKAPDVERLLYILNSYEPLTREELFKHYNEMSKHKDKEGNVYDGVWDQYVKDGKASADEKAKAEAEAKAKAEAEAAAKAEAERQAAETAAEEPEQEDDEDAEEILNKSQQLANKIGKKVATAGESGSDIQSRVGKLIGDWSGEI